MQKAYLRDYSVTDFESTVVEIRGNAISLNKTFFYPGGGHQVNDTGFIFDDKGARKVTRVFEENGMVYHEVDSINGINVGDKFECRIDKARRKYLSSLHTAQHVISRIVFDKYKINTIRSEFDVNGGSIVFSSPLQLEWIDSITCDFDAVIKREYEIYNCIAGDIVTVSIGDNRGDFSEDDCCGTHLKNTSQLDNIFIIGFGRKNNILLYDVFGNYGSIKESLKDYYKIVNLLGQKKDVSTKISHIVNQYNSLERETQEMCKSAINAQLLGGKKICEFSGYKAAFVSLSGQESIAKIYKKIIKNAECVYDGIDLCVTAIDNRYLLESFNDNINAKAIMERLVEKYITISKGGGNFKRVDILVDSSNENVFDAIKVILQEIFS